MVEPSTIIPLLNAQQLSMAGLAHGAAVMPEMAQASARELALHLLRQESKQVQKTEAGKNSALVDEEGGGNAGGGAFAETPRRERERDETGDTGESGAPSSAKPLVGNLLNVKV